MSSDNQAQSADIAVTLTERLVKALAEHDDPPGWTCDYGDRPVYECLCGDRSPAIDHEYIDADDVEAASAWHRAHIAADLARVVEQYRIPPGARQDGGEQ